MNTTPDVIQEINEDEQEFLRFFGDEKPEARADTDTRIDWLLERIAKRQRLIAENNAIAEARKVQIEDWRQGENAKLERSINWFQSGIRQLLPPDADSFQEQYGKRSRVLPFGTVGYKKRPDKIEVFDEDKALAWAKAHGLEIKTVPARETVSKTVLKKALKTFNDPDGFEVIKGLDDFFVTPDDTPNA